MTFTECFTDCLRKRGATEKQITLALMDSKIQGDSGHDDPRQMTPKEVEGMTAMMDVLLAMNQDDLISNAERIRRKARRAN